jgi:ATP-binding cassette subfamily B protein
LIGAAAPWAAAGYVVSVLLLSLTPVVQVWLTKHVVDHLLAGAGAEALQLAGLYALALLVPAACQPLQGALMAWLDNRAIAEIDRRLLRAGTGLADLYRVERTDFQDEVRFLQDRAYLAPRLYRTAQEGVGSALTVAGLLLLLGRLHPLIPLALAATTVPRLIAERRRSRLMYQLMKQHSRAAREMDYCLRMVTGPLPAKEVRVFELGGFFRGRFQERLAAALAEMTRLRLNELRVDTVFGLVHGAALAGAFWYVAAQTAAGRLTLGDLSLYLAAAVQAEMRLTGIAAAFGSGHDTLLHLRTLFRFLDTAAPTIALPPPGTGLPAPAALRTGIELRRVSFCYPQSPTTVLDGVDAVLPAGKVTALVGANGAGKSTLVKLLTRMYDPSPPHTVQSPAPPPSTEPPSPPGASQLRPYRRPRVRLASSSEPPSPPGASQPPGLLSSTQPPGEILLDGRPLAVYDLASLRRRIAVVYQDFAHFSLTLRENVAVGAFDAAEAHGTLSAPHASPHGRSVPAGADEAALDQVEQAARWAGADAVAASLPHGYETQLTRQFEGGVDLSGGEWQKVALARGFIRDAALVILDEPTAALDADAEYRLFEQFRELVASKTALLISHRFSTVRMADHILVLDGGRIVEAGSHAALLALGGRYATLFEMQAARYRW